ncbi:MAG: ribonuclease P protein component [Candidatus Peregrinibacteria bacterium]|nr:ribonuclease P protein component [Candidatus Peregrinibacteria bacterium]
MLKRQLRLTKKDNILKIIKDGNRVAGKFFLCKFLENKLEHCRFAIIVSKKVEKKAVKRNKCRRRIYEAIRNNVNNIGSNKSYDIVILTNQSCLNASFSEIEQEIKKINI